MSQQSTPPPKAYAPIGSHIATVARQVRDAKANGGRINGLSTGFRGLDEMLDGLRPKTLTVLGARPKQGKTAFAVSVMRNMAKMEVPIFFASMEMSAEEITRRLVAMEANISYESLTRGRYDDSDEPRIRAAFTAVKKWPIMIDDNRNTVSGIYEQAKHAMVDGAKVVFVDYMQYITPPPGTSRYEGVTTISMGLAEMRKALNLPIFALAQLSRKTTERATEVDFTKFNPAASRPRDSDLRESGQIEQDADALLFLNRPEVYLEDMKPTSVDKIVDWESCMTRHRGKAEVIVHFNRNGRRGITEFYFIGHKMLFEER
jgi:replicative DNA helicase